MLSDRRAGESVIYRYIFWEGRRAGDHNAGGIWSASRGAADESPLLWGRKNARECSRVGKKKSSLQTRLTRNTRRTDEGYSKSNHQQCKPPGKKIYGNYTRVEPQRGKNHWTKKRRWFTSNLVPYDYLLRYAEKQRGLGGGTKL